MSSALRRCMHCRERQMRRTTIARHETSVDHDGRSYPLVIKDFEVSQCANCGAVALDDAADDRISEALREAAGLLQPAEIVENRNRLNLTQKQLAAYLRIAESTLCRWETGGQIQQRAMNALLQVFFGSAQARSILGMPEPSEPLRIAFSSDYWKEEGVVSSRKSRRVTGEEFVVDRKSRMDCDVAVAERLSASATQRMVG